MADRQEDTLFQSDSPLAHALRPKKISDIIGQTHFLNQRFQKILESDRWTGFIFWGPPGTGKTTLASIIADTTSRTFHMVSAVTTGVKEIREILLLSQKDLFSGKKAHILFIDEIHRLNKAQQDVLLPFLEEGSIRLIGATTENPSFEINNAISSRCVIFNFKSLSHEELLAIVKRAAVSLELLITDDVLDSITHSSLGDARRALTMLEHLLLSKNKNEQITLEDFEEIKNAQTLYYDKHSEQHYDTISAFIKSVRGSDPDAAIYYLARMLEGGEDPLFIARRLIILASEDIGNANPMGLVVASSAFQAVHAIGMPEARIILSQATTYLACSEKSNRSYVAIDEALSLVKETGNLEIPLTIRNAPTKAMKDWGYGKDYLYPHNSPSGWVSAQYLPDKIKNRRFYRPSPHGSEKKIEEFLKSRGKE